MHAPIADQPAAEIIKAAPVERQVKTEALRPCEPAAAAAAPAAATAALTPTAAVTPPAPAAPTAATAHRPPPAALPARAARGARRDETRVLLIPRGEWTRRRAAKPQIPIERVGHGGRRRNLRHFLRPTGATRPGVDFPYFADLARPEDFAGDPRPIVRITLIAHLRGDFVPLRRLRQQPRLPRRAGQRLLDVNALAHLHASQRGGRVHMIGRADHDGVNLLVLFVEHLAKVLVLRGLLPAFEALLAAFPIHVGQRDDVLGLALAQIAERLAASADAGDVQFFVGRLIAQRLE